MLARIFLSLVLCTLVACGGTMRAPVEDRVPQQLEMEHIVARGDTLYSIAFRYGLDYRKVAAANGIRTPYTIYPGQHIRLEEAPTPASFARTYPGGALPAGIPAPVSGPVTTARTYPEGGLPAGTPAPASGLVTTGNAPVAKSEPAVQPPPARTPPVPVVASLPPLGSTPAGSTAAGIAPAGSAPDGKVGVWLWPTTGPVTRGFSTNVHKGIDIGGDQGDPVVAVAAGSVVYAGTGIVGFGELLIVKHNEVYISAYGHNDQLLVAEGDTVAAGQTIARKGSSGTDTVKLHFEIREAGKPIDPQRLLPRR